MRNYGHSIFSIALLASTCAFAAPAFAQDSGPDYTAYAGWNSQYIAQDFAMIASPYDTASGGVTAQWKSGYWLDYWQSAGAGGAANEIDISGGKSGTLDAAGKWRYNLKVSYWFLSGSGRGFLESTADDGLYQSTDVERTLLDGKVKVDLRAKLEFFVGTSEWPLYAASGFGIPVGFKVLDSVFGSSDSADVSLEGYQSFNLTGNCPNPTVGTFTGTYHPTDYLALGGTVKAIYFDDRTHWVGQVQVSITF